MKKMMMTLALATMLLFALTSFAFADSFSLHGDVTFDMTAEEMIAAEQGKGFEPTLVTDNSLLLATEYGAGHTYNLSAYSAVYEVKGSFVSDGFTRIYYMFDGEGKLCQMIYAGGSCYHKPANIQAINDAMADLYKDKYGSWNQADMDIDGVVELRDIANLKVPDDGFIIYGVSTIPDGRYQWLVPYDNMYCEIEMQGLKWSMTGNYAGSDIYYGYSYLVGYTRVTAEQFDNAVNLSQETVNQFMSDI